MSDVVGRLIEIFREMRRELEETGWLVDDPESSKWWGGAESPDEVVITAILVQQTRWEVVNEVLNRLRALGLNKIESLANVRPEDLAEVVKGVNYRFTKALRLTRLAKAITEIGGLNALKLRSDVRDLLLRQDGVGEETADSIMLFALNIPSIPISQYTRRVIGRALGVDFGGNYRAWKDYLERLLPRDLYVYKLFHAAVVTIGKKYCLKDEPRCGECPLRGVCRHAQGLKY